MRTSRLLTCFLAVSALVIGTVVPAAAAATASVSTTASTSVSGANSASAAADPATTGMVKTTLVGFDAGNIISDAVFTDKNTMTEAQIQAFFNSKVSRCLGGTDENGKPIVCLKDFTITSVNRPADAYCSGYTGAPNESAARIIYRVAQSCNINPQVLIVMLQKEQGLITHTWPSAWRFNIALGQGCPDTAACDPNYIGFFHQIYGAARQMQIYMEGKWFQWYAPGKTWNILYNPNTSCGRGPVYVANKATSALYYYTPYQPNAAALNAGYGTGDACSAYGNRNFYNYFTDWFGSTQVSSSLAVATAAIQGEYLAQGGTAGPGSPASEVTRLLQNGGGYARAFTTASIYWTPSTGAKTVWSGALREYYFARQGADGPMGWPVLNQQPLAQGAGQLFTGGSLYSGPKGTFLVAEPLRSGYFAQDGANGPLGMPTADQVCSGASCSQTFEGGTVFSSGAGVFGVSGSVFAAYSASGGVGGSWGAPVSALASLPGGVGQAFGSGSAYALTNAAAYFVSGPIRDHYFGLGGATGRLGFPISAQSCTPQLCVQEFQYGSIMWSAAGGARVGAAEIDAVGVAQAATLGAKVPSSFVYYTFNGGGMAEGFANGAVFFKRGVGAFAVTGRIRDAYFAAGGAAGSYGWPTGAQVCSGASCSQTFEGGTVFSSGAGVFGVSGSVFAAYSASGGVGGSWGAPVSALASLPGGVGQAFGSGSAYALTNAAAYFVSGPIRDHYFGLGGATGRLGFPISAQSCTPQLCVQEFQYGSIMWSAAGGARVGAAEIDAVGVAQAATLGAKVPSSFVYYTFNGGGMAEGFANGAVFFKRGVGAFAVTGRIRDAYFAAGGAAGSYGWPTGAQVCSGASCSQTFQGGTIRF